MAANDADLLWVIDRLNHIGVSLSSEDDSLALQSWALRAAKDIIRCDGGTMYAINAEKDLTFEVVLNDTLNVDWLADGRVGPHFPPVPLYHADGAPNMDSVVAHAVLLGVTIIPDAT